MPMSSARWINATAAWSSCTLLEYVPARPKLMQPRPTAETFGPLRPSLWYLMVPPRWGVSYSTRALPRQHEVRGAVRRNVLLDLVPELQHVDAGEEILAGPESPRGPGNGPLVEGPSRKVLTDRGRAPAKADIATVGRFEGT